MSTQPNPRMYSDAGRDLALVAPSPYYEFRTTAPRARRGKCGLTLGGMFEDMSMSLPF